MTMQVTVLGSTGSIGTNTLDVIARHPEAYQVFALSAHSRVDVLLAQCLQFQPRFAVMTAAAPAKERDPPDHHGGDRLDIAQLSRRCRV